MSGSEISAEEALDLSDRHCIVGAGFTGLGVAAAFSRHQIPYDQLEADEAIGGNWFHGVYETAHIISSRRTTAYADFPMAKSQSDFPSAAEMLAYLNDYADAFGLRERIALRTRVALIAPELGRPGLWRVRLESGEERTYGGVVICNGHHWDMRWPEYDGEFTGEVLHSKQYKGPEVLRGKRVLVVGGGNSGCDVAVEAARFGAASHISLRRGYWFMPKTIMGVPTVEWLTPWVPVWIQRLFLRAMLRLTIGPYRRYGLEHPKHRIFDRHPTINSQLLYFIKHGTIKPQRDIARLDGKSVHFMDGSSVEVDLIVYATGFHVSVPFVEAGVITWANGFPDLINGILSPRHRNFYVFGIGQPRYGAGPLITAGAETLAQTVRVQPQLKRPAGAVIRALGGSPLRSYLMDPHRSMREARMGARLAPRLPSIERWLEKLGRLAPQESP